jgi:outer membrane protein insertion porin family
VWELLWHQTQHRTADQADFLIRTDLGSATGLDFDAADSIIARGYEAGLAAIPRLVAVLDSAGVTAAARARRFDRWKAFRARTRTALTGRAVASVEVAGLEHYPEAVVLQEIELREGEEWSADRVVASLGNLLSIDRFRSARMELEPDDTGDLKLVVHVEELPAQELGLGIRLSTQRGIEGLAQLRELNTFGTGSPTTLELLVGRDRQLGWLEMATPYLLPRNWTQRSRVYGFLDQLPRFDPEGEETGDLPLFRAGFDLLHIGRYLWRHTLLELGFTREWTGNDQSSLLQLPEDREDYSALTLKGTTLLARESLGSPRELEASFWVQGGMSALGGDREFWQAELRADGFFPFPSWGRVGGHLHLGYSDQEMPAARQFRLGGPGSLIGFHKEEFLGSELTSIGAYYEVRPVARIRLGAMADAGWVWDSPEAMRLSDLRGGFGLGLGIDFPPLPLHLTYGHGSGNRDLWILTLGFPYRRPR